MFSFPEIQAESFTKYFGPAIVLDVNEAGNLALLKFEKDEEEFEIWAKSAVSYQHKLILGDKVLAAGEDINEIFIIGVLGSSTLIRNRLTLTNGSYAVANRTQTGENIQINTKDGEMIFQYDSTSGKSRVNLQCGDLEFVVNKGSLNFISEGNINFKSRQFIEIESNLGIKLSLTSIIGKIVSSVLFNEKKINISSPNLNITSQRAAIHIDDSKYIGNNFSLTIKQVKLITGKIESIANDIICKAKNIYQNADELVQLKAGRLRNLVKTTLHIKAKNSYLRSEEDFKINAEKIHLG